MSFACIKCGRIGNFKVRAGTNTVSHLALFKYTIFDLPLALLARGVSCCYSDACAGQSQRPHPQENRMQIYGRKSSINVQKVLWALAELGRFEGRDYQRIDAGLEFGVVQSPDYLAMNPNGRVPTLVDGEVVLWESNTIVRYLAATLGDGALLPTDPAQRADVERWMDWQAGTFWAAVRVAFLGLTRTPEAERDHAAIKASYRQASDLLRMVDALLTRQPYLARTGFSVADIGMALSVDRWIDLGEKFGDVVERRDGMPALREWHARTVGRAAFKATMA
jgi:glutathione S-transferase